MSSANEHLSPETLAALALGEADPGSGAVVPPIHLSTIYEREPDGTDRSGRAYTRADNPTYEHAEHLLTALERGAGCVLLASGSAAATAVFQALLPGDHVLVSRVLYWGVRKWLAEFAMAWGLDVEFVDTASGRGSSASCGSVYQTWWRSSMSPTTKPGPSPSSRRRSAEWRRRSACAMARAYPSACISVNAVLLSAR
jgi:cystathionine gamma-synthase